MSCFINETVEILLILFHLKHSPSLRYFYSFCIQWLRYNNSSLLMNSTKNSDADFGKGNSIFNISSAKKDLKAIWRFFLQSRNIEILLIVDKCQHKIKDFKTTNVALRSPFFLPMPCIRKCCYTLNWSKIVNSLHLKIFQHFTICSVAWVINTEWEIKAGWEGRNPSTWLNAFYENTSKKSRIQVKIGTENQDRLKDIQKRCLLLKCITTNWF